MTETKILVTITINTEVQTDGEQTENDLHAEQNSVQSSPVSQPDSRSSVVSIPRQLDEARDDAVHDVPEEGRVFCYAPNVNHDCYTNGCPGPDAAQRAAYETLLRTLEKGIRQLNTRLAQEDYLDDDHKAQLVVLLNDMHNFWLDALNQYQESTHAR